MDGLLKTLGEEGLRQFHTLELDAVSAVTQRFFPSWIPFTRSSVNAAETPAAKTSHFIWNFYGRS